MSSVVSTATTESDDESTAASDRVYTIDELIELQEQKKHRKCLREWPVDSFLQIDIGKIGTSGHNAEEVHVRFHRDCEYVSCLVNKCGREWKSSLIEKGSISASHLEGHARAHKKDVESNRKRKPFADDVAMPPPAKQTRLTGFFGSAPTK